MGLSLTSQCEYSQACQGLHTLVGRQLAPARVPCLHPATGCAWSFLSLHSVADMLPGLSTLHAQFEGEGKITQCEGHYGQMAAMARNNPEDVQ